ncbi:hypothetical protein T06_9476 [Trichinella sp. T6]|nr:hypothetical protein T06_9476 [Trichinella sp. T6]
MLYAIPRDGLYGDSWIFLTVTITTDALMKTLNSILMFHISMFEKNILH